MGAVSVHLEQVLSSPFLTGLVAAEHGSRVAWVFDAKGVRNVWVAEGPDFAKIARQVTHYNQDDGQPIASLRLTPDGKTAVYALGTELNGVQESANPASWTKGGSYGGFLTAMGLARDSALFKAGVDSHGVHDWSVFLTEEPFFGNLALRPPDADAAVKLAWESSPDAYVSTWKSPVLLIHGDDDRNVPFSQTVDLAQRLREQNVPFDQLILPDEIHGFLMCKDWVRAYTATADFFDRTLKRGEQIGTGN